MSVHVCQCQYRGHAEWHLRYPGLSEQNAQLVADAINGGVLKYSKLTPVLLSMADFIDKQIAKTAADMITMSGEGGEVKLLEELSQYRTVLKHLASFDGVNNE